VLPLGGAALVALGSILTWARVSPGFIDFSRSGLDGDEVLTLPGALVFGGLAASSLVTSWSTGRMVGALVVAVLVGLVAAFNIADLSSRSRTSTPQSSTSTCRSASGSGWYSPVA
jgi:hypothetical protein